MTKVAIQLPGRDVALLDRTTEPDETVAVYSRDGRLEYCDTALPGENSREVAERISRGDAIEPPYDQHQRE